MSRTYQATGIILKGMPLGEADRLLTILTAEYGLIRAVAPGARKHQSRLRGRSELFVVNELLLVKGRSLDKITQAETLTSYPGLSRHLGKLCASQYLAELVLNLALSEQPQAELYQLLNEHLGRLESLTQEAASQSLLLAHLSQAVFHILALVGICPQTYTCCLSQSDLQPNSIDPNWRVGFSFAAGGLVNLSPGENQQNNYQEAISNPMSQTKTKVNLQLDALELTLLQQLAAKSLPDTVQLLPQLTANKSLDRAWIKVERSLRKYVEYHCGKAIRSGQLVDNLLTY